MVNPTNVISLRLATSADERALRALIEASVRVLQKNDYTAEQIDGALGTLLGLDTQLVADGTYFVAEAGATCARLIVGCGGWSHRKTLFGSDHAPVREPNFLDPATDAAKIRAFFIHPDWARRGLGSKIRKDATCCVLVCPGISLDLRVRSGFLEPSFRAKRGISLRLHPRHYTICFQNPDSREANNASFRAFHRKK